MKRALAVLVAILGVAVVVETAVIASTRHSIDQLRDRLDRIESKQRDTARRDEVAKLEDHVERVESQVADVKRAVPPAAATPSTPALSGGETPTVALTPEQIAQLVDQKVDEKVKARIGTDNGFGGKKRPLADVAKQLEISKDDEAKMAETVNEAKSKVFELLKLTRADGTNMADELISAVKSGEKAQENTQAVLMRLFTEKIPNSDETYIGAVLRISEETVKKFGSFLAPEKVGAYRRTGVGPMDLETGYDPFAEYMKGK